MPTGRFEPTRGFHLNPSSEPTANRRAKGAPVFNRQQLSVGVASQALSSLTNFMLVVAIARATSATEFGGFAISYSVALVMLGIGRGLVGETLSVAVPAQLADEIAGDRSPIASALGIGMVGGGCMAVGGLSLLGGAIGGPLLAFAIVLPMVLAQDALRFLGFARQQADLALKSDFAWLGVQAVGFALVALTGSATVIVYIIIWGLSAAVSVAVFLPRTGRPRTSVNFGWLREHRSLGFRFAGEFTIGSGASHITLYLVGALAGLPAAGALRAGESMYGPLNSVLTGLQSVLLPAASRGHAGNRPEPARLGWRIGVVFALLAVLATLVLTRLPDAVGAALLGESWPATSEVLLPLGLMYVATGMLRGMLVSLKAAHAATTALKVRSISGVLLITFGGVGVLLAGARGAAMGMAAAQVMGASLAALATSRIAQGPGTYQTG